MKRLLIVVSLLCSLFFGITKNADGRKPSGRHSVRQHTRRLKSGKVVSVRQHMRGSGSTLHRSGRSSVRTYNRTAPDSTSNVWEFTQGDHRWAADVQAQYRLATGVLASYEMGYGSGRIYLDTDDGKRFVIRDPKNPSAETAFRELLASLQTRNRQNTRQGALVRQDRMMNSGLSAQDRSVRTGRGVRAQTKIQVPSAFRYAAGPTLEPSWIRAQRAERALLGELQAQSAEIPLPTDFSGRCIGVTDGDTIKVLWNRQSVAVRLYGVDCPEKKQAFGARAKQFTSTLTFGKMVQVYGKGRDRYGRTLGWVFVGKSCLNAELVSNGLAWHYKTFAPKETKLAALEVEAKTAKRGLWLDEKAVAPWAWRKS